MFEERNTSATIPPPLKIPAEEILNGGRQMILPMLPLRGLLIFPNMITHLDVGRDRSINAVDKAMLQDENLLFLVMQKDSQKEDPCQEDLHQIGAVARVRQVLKLPGGAMRLLMEGLWRASLDACIEQQDYVLAYLTILNDQINVSELELEALRRSLTNCFEEYARTSRKISPEAIMAANDIRETGRFTDLVASQLHIKPEEKQTILAETCLNKRIEATMEFLCRELEIAKMEQVIAERVRKQIEQNQKEYYLREQIKAIQKELGEKDERIAEAAQLRRQAEEAGCPESVLQKLDKELERLAKMPPMMAEAAVIQNYADWLINMPWNKKTKETHNIKRAESILAADHYGLEKPKERILEYLATCQLTGSLRGPIICLVGPPGVGKTSLARSVARALKRNFVRMSLGGVRDEAEIRGHRRTYIGAMPGRLVQNIRKAGSINPLFLLDEIDKMSSDFRGDPASALLEALDPEQNNTFVDHYMEIPIDLSQVMFITTANVRENIPKPLQDRMEIIDISSYTEEEKVKIAQRHLIHKQFTEHGLEKGRLNISENTLKIIIRDYTREAGVRELERHIAKLCRRVSKKLVAGEEGPFVVNEATIQDYLGIPRYHRGKQDKQNRVGVALGLAVTQVGGELLSIEAQTLTGNGKISITGQLGEVMKESAQAALTYIRSISIKLGIDDELTQKTDLHIHVPEGATPKDGPSAGITLASALASQLSGRRIRGDIAMTGEITLRGRVLAVGGVKEKLLAAYRAGIKEIILPQENEKDVEELPANIRSKLTLHLVDNMSQVLELVLC
ncbi:MAG: endopeptidase La [Firmicutes bacterium]|nr:endopeptidase La [Bacillota bacterium]